MPVAFCFIFAFWELRTAERFHQWATRELNARLSSPPLDKGPMIGPAPGLEAALLSRQVSELQTELSQLRSDMVWNDYSHQASVHNTIALVLVWVGMLGGVLLTAVWRTGRDLQKCRAQIRRLEEELAKRERRPPGDWCSGASLERHLKRVIP
jgi:hypothetical protein